jgi:hypothetical protein
MIALRYVCKHIKNIISFVLQGVSEKKNSFPLCKKKLNKNQTYVFAHQKFENLTQFSLDGCLVKIGL